MKKLIVSALLGATAMIAATPAHAGDSEGKLQGSQPATEIKPSA